MISSSQRPLPDNTKHSQQKKFHAPVGIQTHNLSRRTDADLRLRPRGIRDRLPLLNRESISDKGLSLKSENVQDIPVAYPGILFGGGVSTNSVEDRGQREPGSGGGSPLIRGSEGSCSLVQEISFRIVKFS